MRIFWYGSLKLNDGGLASTSYLTMKGLNNIDVDVKIAVFQGKSEYQLVGSDVNYIYIKKPLDHKFCYSITLKDELRRMGRFDIFHSQGIWLYPTYAMINYARKLNRPYVITPHGMLYPQDIAKSSSLFKRLSLKWRLLDDLNKAACIHVTCDEEMKHCRDLGVTSPISVVPNPVEIKDYPYKKEDIVRRIGYLGRLSSRKNVEGLIRAFAEIGEEAKDAELLIIGGGDGNYERYLRQEVERCHLDNVRFAGFLSGDEKDKAVASCSVLAMPSEFENFGNVVAEGLVRGIPCIATTGSPWEELRTHRCGWWVPYSQEDITYAVRSAINVTQEKLDVMGKNGRKLMEEKYSVEAVAQQVKSLYLWILGEGERPSFVYTI